MPPEDVFECRTTQLYIRGIDDNIIAAESEELLWCSVKSISFINSKQSREVDKIQTIISALLSSFQVLLDHCIAYPWKY